MFNMLSKEETDLLTRNKNCSVIEKGQSLFVEGNRPLGVFCINKGKIKVAKLGIDGKEQIVDIFKEGDLLGYRTMLADDLYTVSAVTLEKSSICFIPKRDFLEVMKITPDFHSKITREVCRELGIMADSLTNLAQKTVRERLALTLLMLKDTYNLNNDDDVPVAINLSRDDLANIVGTATETLIRMLHDFKEEKLIKTSGRKIMVSNAEGLAKAGNVYLPRP